VEALHFAAAVTIIIQFSFSPKVSFLGITNFVMHTAGFVCILMETFNGTSSSVTVFVSFCVTIWAMLMIELVVNHLPNSVARYHFDHEAPGETNTGAFLCRLEMWTFCSVFFSSMCFLLGTYLVRSKSFVLSEFDIYHWKQLKMKVFTTDFIQGYPEKFSSSVGLVSTSSALVRPQHPLSVC
jgi:hypothetical protein